MNSIPLKSQQEIEIMAENGKILAKIVQTLGKQIKPGIRTKDLNKLAEELIFQFKGKPSFKGYGEFPSGLCVSINEEIVHGVPSERKLEIGDIVSLDLGFYKNGFHADMAVTLPVGEIKTETQKLIDTTKRALDIGIEHARAGNTFNNLGGAIQEYVEKQGYGVVRELCGHGIGRALHEKPQVLNYRNKIAEGNIIKEGMVFCIEPMVTVGDWHIKQKGDGFTITTKDSSLCAHFEHMVAVTARGAKILTKL